VAESVNGFEDPHCKSFQLAKYFLDAISFSATINVYMMNLGLLIGDNLSGADEMRRH
jgi:hypothetical protein